MVMNLNKSFLAAILFLLLSIFSSTTLASQLWQQWESLRWAGLEEFRKNDLLAAQKYFDQALAEAKQIRTEGQNQAVSTHDLAQVYDAEGKREQAETYCKAALELAERISSNSATVMLILQTLEDLKREESKYDDAEKLRHEMNKMSNAYPDSQIMGAATMKPNGTITAQLRLEGPGGSIGHAVVSYTVNDPEYKEVLMHIGPLKPGDSKGVTPLE
jgi:tetratricopeptide (TPR) repeat protein